MNKFKTIKMIGVFAAILLFGISHAWGAKPAVKIYVDAYASGNEDGSSWADAFTDLQDALAAAVSGDEIWVAEGTYKPTSSSDRTVSFVLKTGVALYGGFAGDEKALRERSLDPGLTILSGDIGTVGDDTDNSFHVVYADGVTGAVLDGFTVTLGRGDGGGNVENYKGAGIYNTNSALTVANCIFSDNRVAVRTFWVLGLGAGMYNHNSAPIVTKCTFIANQAGNVTNYATGCGGGMYNEGYYNNGLDYPSPVITQCTFRDNVASSKVGPDGGGGGMYNYGSNLTVDSCTFTGNLGGYGGGMINFGGYPTITNCIFNNNATSYSNGLGGAIFNLAHAFIVNCTFYQNGCWIMPSGFPRITVRGGAIHDGFGLRVTAIISNCIFSENVDLVSGAVYSWTANPKFFRTTLTNCLFYKNNNYGSIDDVNNLYDIDPLLEDPAGGDFHLRYNSPCIDAGYSLKRGYLPYPLPQGLQTTDFEGDKRIMDGDGDGESTVDIGVDEFIPNLPDLGAFIEDLADSGELDEATAARLLDYVDDAQMALDEDAKETAISILNELIADVRASLGETETAQIIEMKTEAVIEGI